MYLNTEDVGMSATLPKESHLAMLLSESGLAMLPKGRLAIALNGKIPTIQQQNSNSNWHQSLSHHPPVAGGHQGTQKGR